MKNKNIFYLFSVALLVLSFLFFSTAYKELTRYTQLSNRTSKLYSIFQNLSRQINNAAIVNPDLVKASHSFKGAKLFFTDSQSVIKQLDSLQSIVLDSINIQIVTELNREIKQELSWIIKSEVPDSIIKHRSPAQIAALQRIDSLTVEGIQRTSFLIEYRNNQLDQAVKKVISWMIIFIILAVILFLYATFHLFRQKLITKSKERALEISNRLLKNAQSIGQMGNWEHNMMSGKLSWSDEVYTIWGLSRDTFPLNYQSFIETIHPDDREKFTRNVATSFNGIKENDFEHRIVLPDGSVKWVHEKGKVAVNGHIQPNVFEGTVQDITQRKKSEIKLRESAIHQSLLAAVVNSCEDAIISKTLDGIITSWNHGAEMIFGYTEKEAILQHISIIIPVNLKNEELNIITRIQAGEYIEHFETERLKKDGSRIKISLTISPVLDVDGNIVGASKIARDITYRKRAEMELRDNEAKFRALFENSMDGILLTNSNGKVSAANPAACLIFDMTETEICAASRERLVDNTDPNLALILEERLRTGRVFGELTFIRKNGERFRGEFTSSIFNDQFGEGKGSMILRDITERKMAKENLEKSEKRFRTLIENNNDIISLMDGSFRIFYRSPSAFRITGWTNDELKDVDARLNIHPGDIDEANDIIKDLMENPGKMISTLFRNLHKDGHYIWLEGVVQNLLHDENVKAIVFNFRDVTERIVAKENLEKSEKRFRALIDNSDDFITLLDENLFPFYRSPSTERITGYSSSDIKGENDKWEIIHPDYIGYFKSRLDEIKANPGIATAVTYKLKHKKGHYIWVGGTFTDLFHDPNVKAIVINLKDITQRKEAEEKLKESESHYRSLIDQATDAICIADASLKFIDVNAAACRQFGYTKEEFLNIRLTDILPEEELKTNPLKIDEVKSGKTVLNERRLTRKDGSTLVMEVSTKMLEDEKFLMYGHDITQRKNEELQKKLLAEFSQLFNEAGTLNETLHKAVERLVGFGDFSMAEAWLIDKDQKRISMVARFPKTATMQFFYDETTGLQSFAKGEGLPGVTWETNKIQFWRYIDENKDFFRRDAAKKANLKTVYGLPIIFKNEVTGVFVLGLADDEKLTGRFSTLLENLGIHAGAEINRKQLEQELNQIFSFAPDIICITGYDGYFKKINPAACELLEYRAEELMAVPYLDFIHADDKFKTVEEVQNMPLGVPTFYIENRYITKSGKIKWLAWTSSLSPDEGLIFSVGKDITGKKELEELLNKVSTLAQIGGWEVDLLKGTVYWTAITKAIHEVEPGYLPDLQTGLDFYKEGETRDFIGQKVRESIEFGKPWDEELQIITTKGNEKWIRTIGETEFAFGKCVRIYGSFQDIDQRKKAEIELQKSIKSLEDYRFAIDQSSILAITDPKGVITYINDNFCKISKYDKQELIGKTHKIVNSDYHSKEFFRKFWDTISSGKVWRGEIKNRAKDGTYYWVYTTIVPFLDLNNIPLQYLAIRFDITEKKLAEENVIKTLNDKNTILESIGDAFFAVDKNWIVTYWNRIAEKVLHTRKVEIVGHHLWTVFADSIDSESYKKYHQAIETRQMVHFEDFYPSLHKWYEISAYPSEIGLSVYFKDVTERKIADEKIILSNDRYNMVAKATSDSIWDWDIITGKITRTGNGFSILFGYDTTRSDDNHPGWLKIVHPDDLKNVEEKQAEVFSNPDTFYWEAEYRLLKVNGHYAYVHDKGYILRDENGTALRMIGATQDITQKKEQTDEIIRIQQNLYSLINTNSDMIWSIDTDMKIIAANKAYSDRIGLFTGKPTVEGDDGISAILGDELSNKWRNLFTKCLEGESFLIDEEWTNPITNTLWYNIVTLSPILANDGTITGVVGFSKDVTQLKNSTAKVEEMNIILQQKANELAISNTELEQFAFVASHDLLEPLRMITGFLTQLETKYGDVIDDRGKKFIDFAVDGAKRMRQIILDLLEFSRVGRTPEDSKEIDLNKLISEIQMLFHKEIEEKSAVIQVSKLPVIIANKTPFRQIFQNLLGNALKYCQKDIPIEISITVKELSTHWQFAVIDNGIGIDKEYFDKIFVIFQRLHTKDEYPGTGMGLAVTKKVIDNLGGKIWVESEEGKGSVFYFTIRKN